MKIDSLKKAKWIWPENSDYKLKANKRKKAIIGLDTETKETGKGNIPFLITFYTEEGRDGYSLIDESNWLEVLTSSYFRNSINFFYNLQFDAEGLLRLLDDDFITQIYFNKSTELTHNGKEYKIKYIPKKYLWIGELGYNSKGKKRVMHSYVFYDLYQYFRTSLDKAGEKYLNLHKSGDYGADMDYERFENDEEYKQTIIEYCIRDSEICCKLAVKLFSFFVDQGYSNFISSASLSEEYFRRYGLSIPAIQEDVARRFLDCYYGGRFEVLKRGTWKNMKEYDINSAYPAVMKSMPILTKDYNVKRYDGWDYPLYGSYEIDMEIPDSSYYGLLPKRQRDGLIIFPTGRMQTIVTYPELEFIDHLGLDYSIISSVEIYDESAAPLLSEPIAELYEQKNKAKKEHDDLTYQQVKIILDSLYGKFIQSTQQTSLELLRPEDADDEDLVDINGVIYKIVGKDTFKLGRLFCPIYASYITAAVRCQLINQTLDDTNIAAFHTDSVITSGIKDEGDDIGEWSRKASGELEIWKCGFYKIAGKVKSRGIKSYRIGNGIEKRRIGIGAAVRRGMLNDMNRIMEQPITITTRDRKREWYKLNDEQQDSEPLNLDYIRIAEQEKELRRWEKMRMKARTPEQYAEKMGIDESWIDHSLTREEQWHEIKPSMRDILSRELEER